MGEPGFWDREDRAVAVVKAHGELIGTGRLAPFTEVILIAAWDPRNGGLACQHHHRRFDAHAGSPRAPKIVVPRARLPVHVEEFICDYGFDGMGWLDERFPR